MNSEQTVNNALVKYCLDDFVSLGIDRDELLQAAALDNEELNMLDLRTHRDQFMKLMETGIARSGDPAIGLHIGESLNLDRLGIFGQLILNSRDVMVVLLSTAGRETRTTGGLRQLLRRLSPYLPGYAIKKLLPLSLGLNIKNLVMFRNINAFSTVPSNSINRTTN